MVGRRRTVSMSREVLVVASRYSVFANMAEPCPPQREAAPSDVELPREMREALAAVLPVLKLLPRVVTRALGEGGVIVLALDTVGGLSASEQEALRPWPKEVVLDAFDEVVAWATSLMRARWARGMPRHRYLSHAARTARERRGAVRAVRGRRVVPATLLGAARLCRGMLAPHNVAGL